MEKETQVITFSKTENPVNDQAKKETKFAVLIIELHCLQSI